MALMSVRAYARHRDVSHQAVLKAIQAGRITRRQDGKIDSSKADRQWSERTDHSKPRNSVIGDPKHRKDARAPSTPMGMTGRRRRPGNGHGNGNDEDPDPLGPYAKHRGEREQYAALLVKLEYEREAGLVVDVEEIKQAAYDAARGARDLLLTLPARLAPLLAAMTKDAEVYDALEKELREVADQISKNVGAETKGRRRGSK